MQDSTTASSARAEAERTRAAIERTYWMGDRGFYAFATALPQNAARVAEPGPNLKRRQERLDSLKGARLVDEDTVLPAVPLWFGAAREDHAQAEVDHLASGSIATDWGARILSNRSALYDPLSYHYGSVWPLFTGWASLASYRHGRPHAGFQSLMANAELTYVGALGYVTELLSGDFATAFGRSSHHQVWSEAMVVTPFVRGLLGIEALDGGRALRFAPSIPALWDRVEARGVPLGDGHYDLMIERSPGRTIARIVSHGGAARVVVAPSFPLDARIRTVTVNGAGVKPQVLPIGDVQRVETAIGSVAGGAEVVFTLDEGTDAFVDPQAITTGDSNAGLRILHCRADRATLHLTLEGLGGRSYVVDVRTPRRIGTVGGVRVLDTRAGVQRIEVAFTGPAGDYGRREIVIPLLESRP
jgi:hypothetical protein